MSETVYTQCLLHCRVGDTDAVRKHRAFIPSRFAVVGETVRIRGENGHGAWTGPWVVVEVGQTFGREAVQSVSRAYAKSGVSQ